jgi:hypothetical protein
MSNVEIGAGGRLSLAQRLAQGRIPAGDALRYASLLAESLRRAHDEGRVHGFLTPSVVWLNGPAVELAPPPAGPRILTPYTAPELLLGQPADSRGDIFSFGAILYEMLTGRQAFAGDTQAALVNALKSGQPASTGSPAADKLLAGCLAKDPAGRWQRIQKVILELKLLAVAARRAEGSRRPPARAAAPPLAESTAPIFQPPAEEQAAPPLFQAPAAPCFAPPEPEPAASVFEAPSAQPLFQAPLPPPPDFSAIRGEMQQSESRLATRLQLGEKAMAVLNRAVVDALTGLRSQISTLTTQMAGMQDRANLGLQGGGDAAASEAALAGIEQTLQAFGTRMEVIEKGIGVLQDRVARTELEAEAAKQQVGVLQSSIAEDFVAFKQSLQKQERAVDSARTAMAQTDDLVERLVEALEALQATVLQRSEEWTASVN